MTLKFLGDKLTDGINLSGIVQQTTSGLASTNQACYEDTGGCFSTYGFEYKPGYVANQPNLLLMKLTTLTVSRFDDAYITWYNTDDRAWTLFVSAMAPDPAVEISQRPIPMEPLVSAVTYLDSISPPHKLYSTSS